MGALAIVEGFDAIEDLGASFSTSGEVTTVDEFQFKGAPDGVVVAVDCAWLIASVSTLKISSFARSQLGLVWANEFARAHVAESTGSPFEQT